MQQQSKPSKPPPKETKPAAADRSARRAAGRPEGDGDAEMATWSQTEGSSSVGKEVMPMLVTDKYAATTIPELTISDSHPPPSVPVESSAKPPSTPPPITTFVGSSGGFFATSCAASSVVLEIGAGVGTRCKGLGAG